MKVALELQACAAQMSGIGNYTFQLAKRIYRMEGADVSGNYFNFCMRNPRLSEAGLNEKVEYNYYLPYGVYRRIWDVIPVPYRKMFTPADVTHFFNYIVPPGVSGKVIDTVYDLTYLRYPETMNSSNLTRLQKGMRRSLEQSDLVVTDSEFVKGEIVRELGYDANRIEVVYPSAVEEASIDLPKAYLKEKWGLDTPYLLYLGTIEPRKNINRLIQAYAKVSRELEQPPKLVLAGGKGWNADDTYRLAAETLPDQIRFTGYLNDEEKKLLYRHASLFAFPSLYEGFGIPVLEAMRYGLPVVCSNTSSLPEVAGDSARLVEPTDVNDIAAGILELLCDPARAGQLSQRGKVEAERFSWDRSAEKLMQIYRKLGENLC